MPERQCNQNTQPWFNCNGSPVADSHIIPGLRELLKAFEYAKLTGYGVWDFAVESETLRRTGLTEADFRWLACLGHVDHAKEITAYGNDKREFDRMGKLSFCRRTVFVLTNSGAQLAKSLLTRSDRESNSDPPARSTKTASELDSLRPVWDSQRRELLIDNTIVKQFKWPAVNQELILAVFQESEWPPRIDDPLPPHAEQDPKRRLHDTIKCLNRNQKHRLIRFHGDGTGQGILWKTAGESPRPVAFRSTG